MKRPSNYNEYCAALVGKQAPEPVKKPKSVTITREDLAKAWDKCPNVLKSKISSEFARLAENLGFKD